MKIQPTTDKPQPTFTNKYKLTKPTSYGRRIIGNNDKYNFDVYVAEDIKGNVAHKLYCVWENNKWVKSFLRFFDNNKMCKEIRSESKWC